MTRDEAIELTHEKWVKPNTKSSEVIVDILVALGILKLDEPKYDGDVMQKLLRGCGNVPHLASCIWGMIDDAGLRIVEK